MNFEAPNPPAGVPERRQRYFDSLFVEREGDFERMNSMTLEWIKSNLSPRQQAQALGYLESETPFYIPDRHHETTAPIDGNYGIKIFSARQDDASMISPRVDVLYEDLLKNGLIGEVPDAERRLKIEAMLHDGMGYERIEPEYREEAA